MSMEKYAIFTAPEGTIAHKAAEDIGHKRVHAQMARREFTKLHGAECLYGSDHCLTGIIFTEGAELPLGWRKKTDVAEGVLAIPDKKKPAGKRIHTEMRALPRLPNHEEFTNAIGGNMVFTHNALMWCWYARYNGTLFVMTPIHAGDDNCDENAKLDKFVTPVGCERVPLSVFYAAKEAHEAAKTSSIGLHAGRAQG